MKKIATVLLIGLFLVGPLAAGAAETAGAPANDLWLKARIVTAYTLNRHLNPFELSVDVTDGLATLSGEVDNSIEKDLAGEIAAGVDGIRRVQNDIRVTTEPKTAREEPEFFRVVEDATITATVKSKFLWNQHISGLDINVDTKNGIVTLTGEVESDIQRQLAIQIARNTRSVEGVRDRLVVIAKPKEKEPDLMTRTGQVAGDAWITAKVRSTLLFSRSADGASLEVSTENGVVTLKGVVLNRDQAREVTDLAGNVVGVKEVRADLKVAAED